MKNAFIKLMVDIFYAAALVALGVAIAFTLPWLLVAGFAVLAFLENGQSAFMWPRIPRFFGKPSPKKKFFVVFVARYLALAFGMYAAQLPGTVVGATLGCGSLLFVLYLYGLYMVKNLACAKHPFMVQADGWSVVEKGLLADHSGDYARRFFCAVNFSELLVGLVPAAAILVSEKIGLLAALAVSVVVIITYSAAFYFVANLSRLAKANAATMVKKAMAEQSPTVMLHFSGGPHSAYQVNMWLPVLERSAHKAIVVFRERNHIDEFVPTSVPLVFIDSPALLETAIPPSVLVALYVSNVGKNIHWLRSMDTAHVFIGHGDSDKAGSANNLMRCYNHMLVAGQGHIDRMNAAGLHMPDEYYIKVGRPQLELYFGKCDEPQEGPPSIQTAAGAA